MGLEGKVVDSLKDAAYIDLSCEVSYSMQRLKKTDPGDY